MSLAVRLGLSGNPFEHYTAETEPNIAAYAVRPPYLLAISDRARSLSSFILFGDRGSGKSATRITVYNEMWSGDTQDLSSGSKRPFTINITDYASIQTDFNKGLLTDRVIIGLVAFILIEQILVWLASLEDSEREVYIEGLDQHERTLALALIKAFYVSVPELDRQISTAEALKLLNSAWTTKSAVWASRRWDALSKIFANALAMLSRRYVDQSVDISEPAEAIVRSLIGAAPNASRAIIGRLIDLAQAFGFSGVCALVDKIDETPGTSNSAEATARLIHPLLAHIQLLEAPNFSWILFLWSNVQNHFNDKYSVRLDKIAHANITWSAAGLREMLDARIKFFSSDRFSFADLLEDELNAESVFDDLVKTSVKSPRELIKLLDVVLREHDARGATSLLDQTSLDLGQDKYTLETIGAWYGTKPLQQVLRLGKTVFVNKDVQGAFKIGDQSARVKIKGWEDAGLVRQDGTLPSDLGGKQVYRYVTADPRVERIIVRKLDAIVGAEIEEGAQDEVEV